MKNINEIFAHLKYSPTFKKLNNYTTLQKLINTLPIHLKKGVKFAYIKQEKLFFVLTHPVFKAEFSHNKELIWSLLKSFDIKNISDIRFFVTNMIEKIEKNDNFEVFYIEKSYAIFENHLKDEILYNKVEQIRKIIKDQNS